MKVPSRHLFFQILLKRDAGEEMEGKGGEIKRWGERVASGLCAAWLMKASGFAVMRVCGAYIHAP